MFSASVIDNRKKLFRGSLARSRGSKSAFTQIVFRLCSAQVWVWVMITLLSLTIVGCERRVSAKEGPILEGHTGSVSSVAFSPDGKVLASAGEDKMVKLWNAETCELMRTLTGCESEIGSVVFSPDGKILVTESNSIPSLRLWDIQKGEVLRTIHTSTMYGVPLEDGKPGEKVPAMITFTNVIVSSIAFSPDGDTVAIGGYYMEGDPIWGEMDSIGCSQLLDFETGRVREPLEGNEIVSCVAFSPDGKVLAGGDKDGIVKLWDVETGSIDVELEDHKDRVTSVAFSPDGKILASGSADKTIRLWSMKDHKLVRTLEGHESEVVSIAFSPDGKTLASGGKDNALRLWSVRKGKMVKVLEGYDGPILSVAFSPDGKILAGGSEDKTVRLWHIK